MTNWKLRDEELKKILSRNDDPDDEETSVTNTVAELVPHLRGNPCYAHLSSSVLKAVKSAKTFHTFNQALSRIYDYADDNKVWLGFID